MTNRTNGQLPDDRSTAFLNQPYNFAARVRQRHRLRCELHATGCRATSACRCAASSRCFSTARTSLPDPAGSLGQDRHRRLAIRVGARHGMPISPGRTSASPTAGSMSAVQSTSTSLASELRDVLHLAGPRPDQSGGSSFAVVPGADARTTSAFNWNPWKQLRLYAGVDNLTNKLPPLDLTGIESAAPFDPTGRYLLRRCRVQLQIGWTRKPQKLRGRSEERPLSFGLKRKRRESAAPPNLSSGSGPA